MKLKERIINYLEKKDKDIPRQGLEVLAIKSGYTKESFYETIKDIESTVANIGVWKDRETSVTYLRWYEPSDLTKQVQECLDRGADW